MEIELHLQRTFRNLRFCAQNKYHWPGHPLAIVEDLGIDGKEEVACRLCKKAVLHPPAFKCYDCDILFHISCVKLESMFNLDNDQRFPKEVNHYLQTLVSHCDPGHELIFEEELRNYARQEVLCFACDQPVSGPAYKCSVSDCNLLFHKLCALLPCQIRHPGYDTKDTLFLQVSECTYNAETQRVSSCCCNMCGKSCINCLYYRDAKGKFVLDVACAVRKGNSTYNCRHHTFVPISGDFRFTCQACCTEGKSGASVCLICQLLIHGTCVRFSRAISISCHEHTLLLTFSLRHSHRFKDSHNRHCYICGRRANADYAAYYCQVRDCDFVAHLTCTEQFSPKDETAGLSGESVALITNDVQEMSLEEIHPHNLIFNDEEFTDYKHCDVCMRFISSPPFYSCGDCNFFLHDECARLPREKRHPFHEHSLTLHSQAPVNNGIFVCSLCGHHRHGFCYSCDDCDFKLDTYCCLIPPRLKHPGHQHSLSFAIKPDKQCTACLALGPYEDWFGVGRFSFSGKSWGPHRKIGHFVCDDCDFALCYRCVTLPFEARHEYDKHLFTITYCDIKDELEEYYCLICERKRNSTGWFYYCPNCEFSAHIPCVIGRNPHIKIGSIFIAEEHRHPFTFVRKRGESFPPCDACGKSLCGQSLECSQCKITTHYNDDKKYYFDVNISVDAAIQAVQDAANAAEDTADAAEDAADAADAATIAAARAANAAARAANAAARAADAAGAIAIAAAAARDAASDARDAARAAADARAFVWAAAARAAADAANDASRAADVAVDAAAMAADAANEAFAVDEANAAANASCRTAYDAVRVAAANADAAQYVAVRDARSAARAARDAARAAREAVIAISEPDDHFWHNNCLLKTRAL